MKTPNIHPADLLPVQILELWSDSTTAHCHGSLGQATTREEAVKLAAIAHINKIADICGYARMGPDDKLEVHQCIQGHYLVVLPERFRLRASAPLR